MLNFGWGEILVIVVIAIIVVGPKELPGMLRTFGRVLGKARRMSREVQTQFNEILREAERQADLEDVRKEIDSVRAVDPAREVRKGLSEVKDELGGKVDDSRMPKPDVAAVAADSPTRPAAAAGNGSGAPAAAPDADSDATVPAATAAAAPHEAAGANGQRRQTS